MSAHGSCIDFSQVRSEDLRGLSSALLAAIKRFYADPANVERFQKWKAAYDAEMEAKKNGVHS